MRLAPPWPGSEKPAAAVRRGKSEVVEAIRNAGDEVERGGPAPDSEGCVGLAAIEAAAGLRILSVNDRLCGMSGHSRPELEGAPFVSLFHPVDRRSISTLMGRAGLREISSFSAHGRLLRQDQSTVAVEVWCARAFGADSLLVMVRGSDDGPPRAERETSAAQHLAHSTRNLLTIVQVLARQIAQQAKTAEEFESQFAARLAGIAATYDLVSSGDWTGADLAALLRRQLRLFGRRNDERISYRGPPLLIRASAAQYFGMALYELTDNACKFGALSHPDARVDIEWSDDNKKFRLSWSETGSPSAAAGAGGFGEMVLKEMIAYACHGAADLVYTDQGVRWRLDAPLDAVVIERPAIAKA